MTDPIADFLTRIRNASAVGRAEVSIPYSKILESIGTILVSEGFLENVVHKGRGPRKILVATLRYIDGKPVVDNIRRISRPGRRMYLSARKIRNVKSGFGVSLISTPKGILTNKEAKKENVGGEVLCEIW